MKQGSATLRWSLRCLPQCANSVVCEVCDISVVLKLVCSVCLVHAAQTLTFTSCHVAKRLSSAWHFWTAWRAIRWAAPTKFSTIISYAHRNWSAVSSRRSWRPKQKAKRCRTVALSWQCPPEAMVHGTNTLLCITCPHFQICQSPTDFWSAPQLLFE